MEQNPGPLSVPLHETQLDNWYLMLDCNALRVFMAFVLLDCCASWSTFCCGIAWRRRCGTSRT